MDARRMLKYRRATLKGSSLMDHSDQQPSDPSSIESISTDAGVVPAADRLTPDASSALTEPAATAHATGPGSANSGQNRGVRDDVINAIRGFCMGAADTVPGVSGGTIALIMGHYARLVTAISHIDTELIGLIRQRKWRAAADHIDLRFLVALGAGLLLGVVSLAGLMHYLLDAHFPETLAVFLGLLIASLWVVVQYIDRWTTSRYVACGVGIAIAAVISMLPTGHGNLSLPYIFMAASIAICAMILPGISGAYVLLVLGVYHGVTGVIKDAAKLQITTESALQLIAFGSGCLFGLLSFSRLLRRLLESARGTTMAALMGLMIGSVGKLWPLQKPTADTAMLEPKFRVMEYVAPSQWDGSIPLLVALVVASAAIVLAIEWLATRSQKAT